MDNHYQIVIKTAEAHFSKKHEIVALKNRHLVFRAGQINHQ